MKNPITVERKKYLNGASYVAKLGQVEEQAATREEAEQLLLRSIDAMAIKTLAVRALTDGRVAVLQCLGADSGGFAWCYSATRQTAARRALPSSVPSIGAKRKSVSSMNCWPAAS